MTSVDSVEFRRRAWRWHFLAALIVVPFVLWQSITGTLYLWSYAWTEFRHPALLRATPGAGSVSLDLQVEAARALLADRRITGIAVPGEPGQATRVLSEGADGLPLAVFVDPTTGAVRGALEGWNWLPGWTRKLHGGWPLGDPGSWLLEIGAGWTIVMVLTGWVLWWPNRPGGWWRALWPRWSAPGRTRWRDLHACVALWISGLLVAFLFTALPWTSFWGRTLLAPLQHALDQRAPAPAGHAPVFLGGSGADAPATRSLQSIVEDARKRGMRGELMLRFVDGPQAAAISVRTASGRASQEQYALYPRTGGDPVTTDWSAFPLMARAVATGVSVHEGGFFGGAGLWLNTAFAAVLVWVSVTGTLAWWKRKPAQGLGLPARATRPWPTAARWTLIGLCALLPLLALSVLAALGIDHMVQRRSARA